MNTRKSYYLDFILNGGDILNLPSPETYEEKYLYDMCIAGHDMDNIYPKTKGEYVKAILNSNAGGQNYLAGIHDLGVDGTITDVMPKVKIRFTLRNTGADKPTSARLRLAGNNTEGIGINPASDYYVESEPINNPEFNKQYTLEYEYIPSIERSTGSVDLSGNRYLKAFLRLDKSKADSGATKVLTHGLDIHEFTMTIGEEVIDLLKISQDFDGQSASKIEFIKDKYVKAIVNSNGGTDSNFASFFFDMGQTGVTSAKIKAYFTLRNTGNAKPTDVSFRLIADNVNSRDIDWTTNTKYQHDDKTGLVGNLDYDVEYVVTGDYSVTASGNKQLSTFRYLKPLLKLTKVDKDATKDQEAHGIEIRKVTVEVNGKVYDITGTFEVLEPKVDGVSKVEILDVEEEDIYSANALRPYAGKKYGCIGDSIVYGYDPSNPNGRLSRPHTMQVGELCGFKEAYNYGISSSTIATKTSDSAWNGERNPICERFKYMSDDLDVISISAGINDFWLGVPLGDISSTDKNTFYGAYKVLIEGLINKYPDKKIFAMTPLDYKGTGAHASIGYGNNSAGYNLQAIRKAIHDVCELYSIPVLDMEKLVGFSTRVPAVQAKYLPDFLHPSQIAVDRMSLVISKFINGQL